jgi:O-methyltransferase involved in polyketide biosynthesis
LRLRWRVPCARPSFWGRVSTPSWLGVVPYLPHEAITSTLRFIAGVPESVVVFDYTEPLANYPERRRAYLAGVAARTAALGEPWISYFDPGEISAELREHGFREQDDVGLGQIAVRYPGTPWEQAKAEQGPGPHVIRAHRVHR